jgi:hypothetical protein
MTFTIEVTYTDNKIMKFQFSLWDEVTKFLSRLELRTDLKNWKVISSDYQ